MATLPRTWLETLCIGISNEHPKLSAMSRAAYKQLRNEADQQFASFRFGDLNQIESVVNTPLICIAQLLNRISSLINEESKDYWVHKYQLDEIKANGVIFRGNRYTIEVFTMFLRIISCYLLGTPESPIYMKTGLS